MMKSVYWYKFHLKARLLPIPFGRKLHYPMVILWCLFFGKLPSDPAQALRSNAKKGGYLMIGDPGFDMGIPFPEFLVTFQGRFAEGCADPLHGGDECTLQKDAEIFVQLRHLLIEKFQVLSGDLQHFGVFQAVHIVVGGNTRKEAIEITHPPVFRAKEKDMFLSFGIDLVCPGESFDHKGLLVCYIPFLKDILVLPEFPMREHGLEDLQFLLVKDDIPGSKILNK